jgi:hypothetical protein
MNSHAFRLTLFVLGSFVAVVIQGCAGGGGGEEEGPKIKITPGSILRSAGTTNPPVEIKLKNESAVSIETLGFSFQTVSGEVTSGTSCFVKNYAAHETCIAKITNEASAPKATGYLKVPTSKGPEGSVKIFIE